MNNRGQTSPAFAIRLALAIGLFALIGIGVVVPIINDTLQTVSLTGIEGTIAGFISTIVILLLFMVTVRPVVGGP